MLASRFGGPLRAVLDWRLSRRNISICKASVGRRRAMERCETSWTVRGRPKTASWLLQAALVAVRVQVTSAQSQTPPNKRGESQAGNVASY